MRDFLKLAKQKLKASRPKSQSPTSVAVAQINDPVQAQSESVQPLSTPEPQAAVVSDEATRSHLPDIPETSSEPNPLLEEARKRYKESTESLDQVYELYVTKKPNARLKAKDSEAIVQLLLETGGDKVPMLPLGRVATAVSKLMPLMKLALGLTQNVADVCPLFSIVSDGSGWWFWNSQTEGMWLSGSLGSTNSPAEDRI